LIDVLSNVKSEAITTGSMMKLTFSLTLVSVGRLTAAMVMDDLLVAEKKGNALQMGYQMQRSH
jgi:hypothetical protein